jgi:hypothetical protein
MAGAELGDFAGRIWLWRILLSDAVDECGDRSAAVPAAALMRLFGIVLAEVLAVTGYCSPWTIV